MSCRPERLVLRPPGRFRALAVPRPVVVVKRKHGDPRARWEWEGDLVGTAGRGWRVVRHVRGAHERRLVGARSAEPQTAVELRWLGTRAPATILVKLDEDARIVEVKLDAALPVPLRRGRFIFTDLDVDVVRDGAGAVDVRDWDTFETRQPTHGYSEATRVVVAAGETFARRLLAAWEPTLVRDVAAILAATGTARAPTDAAPGLVPAGGSPRLRRAGRLETGGGETVLWSVAEGRRGRRWRSLRRDAGGALLADLLLEVDPVGRWTRLELATSAGILTLHPEPDGRSARGNVITAGGVVPLAFPWSPGHRLVLPDEPIAAAALGDDEPNGREVPGLVVDARLEPRATERTIPPLRPAGDLPGPSWPLEDDAD